jgi:YVTN family beta-propeller protein
LSEPALKLASTDSSPRDVEVSPDGTLAVVTNSGGDSVSFINTLAGLVEGTVLVGKTPLRVVITPDGSRAYVTNHNSHEVSVIDLGCARGGGAGCAVAIPVGFNPIGIGISPDGSLVYVAEYSSKSVSIIDAIPTSGTDNLAIRTLSTESTTRSVVTDPDRGKILASDSSPRDVEANPDGTGIWIATDYGIIAAEVNLAVDQSQWAVTILVSESSAREANISPDGGVTILASEGTVRTVSADPDGGTTIRTGEGTVRDVESNPDGTMLFMTTGTGELLVYAIPPDPYGADPYKAVTKLGSDSTAREVAISPDGTLVYVTSYETGTVSIYKFGAGLTTEAPLAVSGIGFGLVLIDVISVGDQPEGLAYSPVANIAVVANSGSDTVTILSFDPMAAAPPNDLGDPGEEDLDNHGISDVRQFIATTLRDLEATATGKDQKDYRKAADKADDNLSPTLWDVDTTLPSARLPQDRRDRQDRDGPFSRRAACILEDQAGGFGGLSGVCCSHETPAQVGRSRRSAHRSRTGDGRQHARSPGGRRSLAEHHQTSRGG